ncbi:hypothetical protein TNCV_1428741 [Trichonephila clavipes]|nr:hypothetical protein TNCV_1428741 [Trichonephila clavipes]
MWNCPNHSIRGCRLKTFVKTHDLTIAHPDSPTRFGHRSANILDFAIINNFHFPFTINSLAELSSDHNPVLLNFSFIPRFITTIIGQLPPVGLPLKIIYNNFLYNNSPCRLRRNQQPRCAGRKNSTSHLRRSLLPPTRLSTNRQQETSLHPNSHPRSGSRKE